MPGSPAALRAIGLAVVLLLLSPSTLAQRCEKHAAIGSDADVFENVPRYVTGAGWRGNIQTRLSSGTEVYVCRETNVDFGFGSKTWVQIAYRSGPQWPKYGWVLKEALRTASNTSPGDRLLALFIPAAHAAPTASPADHDGQLPAVPPEVPAPVSSEAGGGGGGSMSVATADLFGLYLPLFVAMVLGMCAKVLVDMLDAWDKGLLLAHLRNGFIAILVSPIVFLGLLNAGQFSGETQTFIVLTLLAFQNGFFWQTVLKRESDRTESTKPALSGKRG